MPKPKLRSKQHKPRGRPFRMPFGEPAEAYPPEDEEAPRFTSEQLREAIEALELAFPGTTERVKEGGRDVFDPFEQNSVLSVGHESAPAGRQLLQKEDFSS